MMDVQEAWERLGLRQPWFEHHPQFSERTPNNPKGILSSSPGLPQPWGSPDENTPTPTGLHLARKDATPLGFSEMGSLSQGCSNPGLEDARPLALILKTTRAAVELR